MQARSFKGSRMSLLAIEDKQPTSQVCKVNLNRKSTLFVQAIYLSKIPKKNIFPKAYYKFDFAFSLAQECNKKMQPWDDGAYLFSKTNSAAPVSL